jgi:hypothetical protein
MNYLHDLHTMATAWARTNISQIALVFTLALLVIYGDNINRAVKNRVRNRNFLIRALAFIVLCSFGYGLLTTMLVPGVLHVLKTMGDRYLVLTIVGGFVLIGFLADQKSYM